VARFRDRGCVLSNGAHAGRHSPVGRIIAEVFGVDSGQFLRHQHVEHEPLHRRLAEFNRARFRPSLAASEWQEGLREELAQRLLEGRYLEGERAAVETLARSAPTQPQEFVDWFEGLRELAARQNQHFYRWLAQSSDRADLAWLLAQELATGEILEDLFSLTELGLPWRAKLELARCYWDEMGQGEATAMRARILDGLERELQIELTEPPAWQCMARSNLMWGLAANRHYAFQSIGALGALELETAGSAKAIAIAMKRLGFAVESHAYFAARAKSSVVRSHAWNHDVILPLVAQDVRAATAIAEGALMRFAADARCIARYSVDLRQGVAHSAA
jgi:hypothetical protein